MTRFEEFDRNGIDPFFFDEQGMVARAVKTVRGLYGITGAAGLLAGIALLFWPVKTLVVLTVVLGVYFIIATVVRLIAAIGTPFLPSGWRALNIITSLLLLFGGIIMVRNQALSAATLTTFVVLATGFGWIIEGVMTLVESGAVHNRGLAVFSGVLSILAGIVVFLFPLESTDMLVLFAGAALAVLGATLLVRAFTFGRVG